MITVQASEANLETGGSETCLGPARNLRQATSQRRACDPWSGDMRSFGSHRRFEGISCVGMSDSLGSDEDEGTDFLFLVTDCSDAQERCQEDS